MAKPTINTKYLNSVKDELNNKLTTYIAGIKSDNRNYAKGNYLDFLAYDATLDTLFDNSGVKPCLTDLVAVGPFTATEIFDSLKINYDETPAEHRAALLAIITDTFLHNGYPVNVYIPRSEEKRIAKKPVTLGAPLPEMQYSKWDSFCAFFGIKTEHSKEVDAYNEVQNSVEKHAKYLMELKDQKKLEAECLKNINAVFNNNGKRVEENSQLVNSFNSEIDNNLGKFFKTEALGIYKNNYGHDLKDSYIELDGNVKISAYSYLSARVFALKGKNIDSNDLVISQDELIQIGKEYTTFLTSTKYDRAAKTNIVKKLLNPETALKTKVKSSKDSVEKVNEAPEEKADSIKHSPADFGKTTATMKAKVEINKLFKGSVDIYSHEIEKADKMYNKYQKACKVMQAKEFAANGDYSKAEYTLKSILYSNATIHIRDTAGKKFPDISSDILSKLYEKSHAFIDSKIGTVKDPAKRIAAVADVILNNRESAVFCCELVSRETFNPQKNANVTSYHLTKNKTLLSEPVVFESIAEEDEPENEDEMDNDKQSDNSVEINEEKIEEKEIKDDDGIDFFDK